MTVLHVLAVGEIGGLMRVVEALACGQRRRHDVHVAAVCEPGQDHHPLLVSLRAGGVGVIPITLPPRAYLQERARIAELCERLRPDVVHTHGYRPDVTDSGVARGRGIPVVTTVHGFTGGGLKNRFYEWLQARSYRRFDAVVAVSRRLSDELVEHGVPVERVRTVRNAWGETSAPLDGAAACDELGIEAGAFHVGWVGRISREKGLDLLVEALPGLADLPLVVSVMGDGPEAPSLQRRAAELGVADRVRWHGIVQDAGRYFAGFDLLTLSSRTEGTPIVLFEAMAAGTPIVATRVGGVPELLTEREAVIVPPGDVQALAGAMRAVHDQPAAAAARAQAARRRLSDEFGVEPWLDRYDAIYRDIQPGQRGWA